MEALKFLPLFALLFIIPLVGAEKVDTDISLTVQCTNSTFANITYAKYISNSEFLVDSESEMTKNGIYYNYSINSSLNTEIGTIEYGFRCDVNGVEKSSGNRIFISIMGEELTTGQGILYIVILFGLFAVLFVTIYGAVVFPWDNNRNEQGEIISLNDLKYLKVVLIVFVYLESLFIVTILKNLSGFLLVEGTYSFFRIFQMFGLIGLIPFFPLLLYFTVILWLSDRKNLELINRGILPT